jgi:hypothetical protein
LRERLRANHQRLPLQNHPDGRKVLLVIDK